MVALPFVPDPEAEPPALPPPVVDDAEKTALV
jgi:hypothetical protein